MCSETVHEQSPWVPRHAEAVKRSTPQLNERVPALTAAHTSREREYLQVSTSVCTRRVQSSPGRRRRPRNPVALASCSNVARYFVLPSRPNARSLLVRRARGATGRPAPSTFRRYLEAPTFRSAATPQRSQASPRSARGVRLHSWTPQFATFLPPSLSSQCPLCPRPGRWGPYGRTGSKDAARGCWERNVMDVGSGR
jgi:hypothetical protein